MYLKHLNRPGVVNRSLAECHLADSAWFCIELTRCHFFQIHFFESIVFEKAFFQSIFQKVGYIKLSMNWLAVYILWCLLQWLTRGYLSRCHESIAICFYIIAWQSWFRRNRHFAFCLCITYYGDVSLCLHMWYSTLAFCIFDFITYLSIASYQEINLSIAVENKLSWSPIKSTIGLQNTLLRTPEEGFAFKNSLPESTGNLLRRLFKARLKLQ